MDTFDVEVTSGGDHTCIDYSSDLESVAWEVVKKFNYDPRNVVWGPAMSSLDTEFYSCKKRRSSHRLREDALEDSYFLIHVIVPTSTWEITNSGVRENRGKEMCLCIWAYECGEEIHVERHAVGQCPYIVLERDLIKTHKFRVDMSFYFIYKGEDSDGDIADVVENKISNQLNYIPDSDDIWNEIEWETDLSTFEVDIQNRKVSIKKLRR